APRSRSRSLSPCLNPAIWPRFGQPRVRRGRIRLVLTLAEDRLVRCLRVPPSPLRGGVGGGGNKTATPLAYFTPPLTPPRHHAEGVSSTRREGNLSSTLHGRRSIDSEY